MKVSRVSLHLSLHPFVHETLCYFSEFVPTSLIGCFNPLAQEELDYFYSTVNKKKKAPDEANQEIINIECSKSTAAGINTIKHLYRAAAGT